MKVGTAQAYNKQVCGSLRSPKLPSATSHTRQPLYEILNLAYEEEVRENVKRK